jgi:multidrug efflux pump subunit AcrA (membrane-fusion protein)
MNRIGFGTLVIGLGIVGCASAPPPHEREASSEAAVRGAREVGAQQFPQAALHLKLAEEQLQKAKAQMNDGKNEDAAYTLLRAQADAELALALARENKTRAEAQQVIDKARGMGGGPADTSKPATPASPMDTSKPAASPPATPAPTSNQLP